jgi:hypothetical protein|tara:strand:+ start:67 stop:237 length:171 start_codon:yes stop_codon:yes gene_type:complete
MARGYEPKAFYDRTGTSIVYYVNTSGDRWFNTPYNKANNTTHNSNVSPDGTEAVAS